MKKSITYLFILIGFFSYSQSFIGAGIGIIQHPINNRFDTEGVYSVSYKHGFQLNEHSEFRTGLSLKYVHLDYSVFLSYNNGTTSTYNEYDNWKYSANIPLLFYFNSNQFRFYLGASIAVNLYERTNQYSTIDVSQPMIWSISDSYGDIHRFENDDFLANKDYYVAHTGIGYVFYKQFETSLNFSAGNRYQYLTLEVNYCFGKRFKKVAKTLPE